MEIDVFTADEMECVFRVLRTALNPAGPLQPSEAKFLETYSRIARHHCDPEPLPIRAGDVRIEGAHRRKRLVQLGDPPRRYVPRGHHASLELLAAHAAPARRGARAMRAPPEARGDERRRVSAAEGA
jgi:hypothetical protein